MILNSAEMALEFELKKASNYTVKEIHSTYKTFSVKSMIKMKFLLQYQNFRLS